MTNEKLIQENERLKRLCRFQFLTLGFYRTKWNYNEGNTSYSGIMFDGGREATEANEMAKKLGFTADEICSWKGPLLCSNCEGSLEHENCYPCKCEKPEIAGMDMKPFRKW
jgi:hypothetical protein